APPADHLGGPGGAPQLELRQGPPLVGDGEETEDAVLVRDSLPEGDDAAMEARRPVQLPQKDHAPLVVPEAIDVLEGVGTDPGYPRDVGRALRLRHEVAEERATVGMRLG